jgi:hypothetical protein
MAFYTSIFSKLARRTQAAKIKPVMVEFVKTPILRDRKSLLEMDLKTMKKYLKNG